MSLAIVQMRPVAGQPLKNLERMLAWIEEAKANGADSIIFPELALTGPLHDEVSFYDNMQRDCMEAADRICEAAEGIRIVFGTIELIYGRLLSRMYLAKNKDLRPIFPMNAAPCWFGGPSPYPCECVPFDLIIDGEYTKILALMGDWRGKELPLLVGDRAEIAICFSPQPLFAADPPPQGKGRMPIIYMSQLGMFGSGKANYLFPGHAAYYDAEGKMLAATPYFEEGIYYWHLDGGEIVPDMDADERLCQGLIHGVREFCDTIHAEKAVIGISGGIDSALAACIYREALGKDNVYLISMPSNFNSEITKSLAQRMAEGLGLKFTTIPINDSRDQLCRDIENSVFVDGSGKESSIKLTPYMVENVMARERGRILAAAAAGVGGIFTCNGNKAEMTVGYATFYGDLAGAFAAMADLWKYQIYQAASWFQKRFPDAPLDEVAAIRPSAELSEAHDVTKGLGDPLTYAYHDYLLKSWVDEGKEPADTLRAYQKGFLERQIGCKEGIVSELFPDAASFIADMEYWWKQYRGIGVAKRLQAPPLLALGSTPFGEGRPQTQGITYFSGEYLKLKAEMMG